MTEMRNGAPPDPASEKTQPAQRSEDTLAGDEIQLFLHGSADDKCSAPGLAFMAPEDAPDIFQARIQTLPDGLFRFPRNRNEFGEWADCAVVRDDVDEWAACIAWLHDKPDEWWFYRERPIGLEHLVSPTIMGMRDIRVASFFGSDLHLLSTPERFVTLKWNGRVPGPIAVVLDWDAAESIQLWLSLPRAIRCEDPELAASIEAVLNDVSRPRLKVRAA